MDTKSLDQIKRLFESNTALLRKEITGAKEELKQEMHQSIARSQEETIEAITNLVETGHENHEKRITRIENKLQLPPLS